MQTQGPRPDADAPVDADARQKRVDADRSKGRIRVVTDAESDTVQSADSPDARRMGSKESAVGSSQKNGKWAAVAKSGALRFTSKASSMAARSNTKDSSITKGSAPVTEQDNSEESEEDSEHDSGYDLACEAMLEQKHLDIMRKARQSTRMTLAPAKLVESVTSRWKNFSEQMVVGLIETKADVHARLEEPWDRSFDDYTQSLGATTLHFAARRGLQEVISSLMEYRADVNATNYKGITPIMVGVTFNQIQAVKKLFNEKASVLQRDKAGICAVDLAVLEGKAEMIEAIQKFEDEEDRTRNDKVREELAKCVQELSDDDLDGFGEEDAVQDKHETRQMRQQRMNQGDTRRRVSEQPEERVMRSSHLLPAALQKTGLNVPSALSAKRTSIASSMTARRPQGNLLAARARAETNPGRRPTPGGDQPLGRSSTVGHVEDLETVMPRQQSP